MKGYMCVGCSLGLLWLAAFVQVLWAGSFQISQVASDILSTVDQERNRWQVGSGPSVLHEPHKRLVNQVPRDRLVEVGSDDWLVNRVSHDQLGKPDSHTRTADSMVPPVVLVPQAQEQAVAQSPSVGQVPQAETAAHAPGIVPVVPVPQAAAEYPPAVQVPQAQLVNQSAPVIQVPQAQIVAQAPGVVAQSMPMEQVPQVQSVAQFQTVVQGESDALAPVSQDEGSWQARYGLSGLEEHRNRLEDETPVARVPYGETVERFPHRQPLNSVQHSQSEERVSDNWRVNWVPQGQPAALDFHTRTADSMVLPVVSVSQVQQQTVAQSPPVVPVAQTQTVTQAPPVVPVAQDQAVVAQPVPLVQVASDSLTPVGQDQWTWQVGHGRSGLEVARRLADLAPVADVPYGDSVERFPHRRMGDDRYPSNSVPHSQLEERVSDDWWMNWVPQGQLAGLDFHTRTADSMVPPVVSGSRAQEQTVAQSPPVAAAAQAQPALLSPLQTPMVTYTRPLVRSVAVTCRENSVLVVVKRDLLGIGQLIQPSDVTLGGCSPTGQDNAAGVLLFQAPLQGCGSTLTMTVDSLVYTFSLVYMPHALRHAPVVRTNGATVRVECRYPRLHNVSSSAIRPTWVPFLATRRSEDRLVFTLTLMSEDWLSPRASNTYFLGDLINVEASVSVAHHVPLRVFVDGCVATLVPNMKVVPRYAFIENHGCLVDGKLTGSRSQFLRRRQPDKLQFQLDAFRFSGDPRSSIYLTCLLKATPASADTNFKYKACSFAANRWVAAGGHQRVCGCCDASCSERRERNQDDEFKGEVLLGPVTIHEFVKGDRN